MASTGALATVVWILLFVVVVVVSVSEMSAASTSGVLVLVVLMTLASLLCTPTVLTESDESVGGFVWDTTIVGRIGCPRTAMAF